MGTSYLLRSHKQLHLPPCPRHPWHPGHPSGTQVPVGPTSTSGMSKYAQLLAVIEEMGRDIRPSYSGSRSSAERLKRIIVHARILVRECLLETERSARN
uniref:Cyclin-dependent kinase 2-associated protein n=1 Tax=Lutzomyia longipalpis TaxID=7200 RepID=A0A1B0CRZ1_LUTLO